MNDQPRSMQRGYGNAERPVTSVLWDRDTRGRDAAMAEEGNYEPDRPNVDFTRYYDRGWAEAEIDKIWRRSWLFAAREEDIPEIGDRVPFDVGPLSFIVARTGADEFKAFYNSCLHRGTKLCSARESGATIKCPYHAWEWKVDGTLKSIPSHWDFPTIDRRNGSLREVKIGRWGGFIYINCDPDAAPFEEALGPIPAHFDGYAMEDRYTAARFRKLTRANWKVAQEAFMESYHVIGTHPAAVPYNGDSQTQYDVWSKGEGHIARQATPSAIPSMFAPSDATAFAAAMAYVAIMQMWHYPDAVLPELDPAKDLRAQVAQWHRDIQRDVYGKDVEHQSDALMIDSILYFVFPHSTVWLSESIPFTYQFTPHPTDPDLCYFETRLMRPCPVGQPRPPSAPLVEVGADTSLVDAMPAFAFLAEILDQDMGNMPLIQQGMKAADPARNHSLLGQYQEMSIQHWNDVFDAMMARP